MTIDLNDMTIDQLEQLEKDVKRAIATHERRRKDEAIAAAREAAKKFGFNLDSILKKEKATGKPAPKYRNPQNPLETWAGRGRQPDWLKARLAAGASLDDFKI